MNSDWVVSDTMLYYSDTFDVSAYWAIVDTPFIESGLLFVDSSEWNDTDYVFISDDPIRFLNTFEFVKQQLSDDSLVFRMNTDCNDNGRWDDSELTGIDYNGNGIYEVLYEYSDNNNNGSMMLVMISFKTMMVMILFQLPMSLLTEVMVYGTHMSPIMI